MQGELSLAFAADHPAFAGHFPGRPIVPGVLLLDAALHAAAQAQQALRETPANVQPLACRIATVKFLSPVEPGEALLVSWTGLDDGPIRFGITASGRQIAAGTFTFEAAA